MSFTASFWQLLTVTVQGADVPRLRLGLLQREGLQDQAVHQGQPGGLHHGEPRDGPHPVLPPVRRPELLLQKR